MNAAAIAAECDRLLALMERLQREQEAIAGRSYPIAMAASVMLIAGCAFLLLRALLFW